MDEFIRFAQTRTDLQFYVTQIGCGIAGFKVEEIASLFQAVIDVENVILPKAFWGILSPCKPIRNSYMVMDRVYAGEYPRVIDDRKFPIQDVSIPANIESVKDLIGGGQI